MLFPELQVTPDRRHETESGDGECHLLERYIR
jgi:hypothetical protein